MNILIMTDIEGISGIYCKEQVLPSLPRFQEGRLFMTMEVNACAEACKEAGADKVFVRDCHGGSYSLIWEKLSESADYYICGYSGDERYAAPEDFDGVILLGYHAMAGTMGGVLEHSMSSTSVQNYWINGEKIGETALDAGMLGEIGKPVILVTGDDKVCREAEALLPGVVTAEVKKGMTSFGAMLLPPGKAHQLIREKTMEAIQKLPEIKPFAFPAPVEFKVELMERVQLPGTLGKPWIKIHDGRTYSVTADTLTNAYHLAK